METRRSVTILAMALRGPAGFGVDCQLSPEQAKPDRLCRGPLLHSVGIVRRLTLRQASPECRLALPAVGRDAGLPSH